MAAGESCAAYPEASLRQTAKSAITFDPAPATQSASCVTAKLATFYAGLTTELTALTKSLKSNPDPDERARTEAKELIRSLETFSRDAAERAARLDEALRVTVQ